jgi:hypothetical protein
MTAAHSTRPESFAERAERELNNIKNILSEIVHLAHIGPENENAPATLEVVGRIAGEAFGVLYGEFWDELLSALLGGPQQRLEQLEAQRRSNRDPLKPARAIRAALEAECDKLSVEEAAVELRGFQCDVQSILGVNPEHEDSYAVVWTSTEKGVKYALAQARLLEKLLPSEDSE